MVEWFTAKIYFYSESEDKKYETDISEAELSHILKNCKDLNQLAEFLAVTKKTIPL